MLVGLTVGIHLPRSAKLVNSYQYRYWFAVNLFGQWKAGIAFRVAHIVWFVVSHLERCVEHAENRRRKVLAWEGVVFDGSWFAKPRESIRNHCEGFMDGVWDSVPLEAFVLCMFVRLHLYRCRWIIDCSGRCSHYIDLVIEPNSRSWSTTFWAMVGSFERVIPFSLQVHPTRWNDSVNQPDSPAASFVSIGSAEWSKPRKSKLFFLDWNAANAVCAINSQSLFDTTFPGSVWCIRRELWSVSIFTPVDSNRSDWYRNRNTERRLDFVVCSVCSFYMFV